MKRLVVSIFILFSLFSVSPSHAVEIRIATGHTFIKRIFDPVRRPFREKTGIDIHVVFNEPVPALALLEKGGVDAAGASLDFEDWLKLAKNDGVAVREIDAYKSYVPVTEKTMILIHLQNRVQTLSKEQLKGIFTGRIQNWKEVGGDDAPILVVWPSVTSGGMVKFRSKIMDNEALAKTVYDVETIGETSDAISVAPEAIGIATGDKADAGVKEVAPAIERPLTLVYKGNPSPNLQKLLDFLKSEGQRYIK